MSEDDFEEALARAVHGEVMTDLRPSPALLQALMRIAAARTPGERRPLIRAARRLHEQEEGDEDLLLDGSDASPEDDSDDDLTPLEDLPDQDRPRHAALQDELLLDDVLPRWADDEQPPRP